MTETPRDRAEYALKQANRAAKSGDLRNAERWSKTAERLSQAADRLAALPEPMENGVAHEALCAELRRRLARFVEADQDIQRWEAEAELFEANLFAALANGTAPPPPLRPHPAGPLGEEAYMTHILKGPEPNDGLKR